MKAVIVAIVLAVLLGITIKDNIEKRNEIGELKESITVFNNAEKKSIKTITKIREVVKNVKEPCDCYNQSLPDDVIKLLQKL